MPDNRSRRDFLKTAPALVALSGCGNGDLPSVEKIRVAALLTVFTYRSHAHVILENFLVPYLFNGEVVDPREEFEIVAFYVDQIDGGGKADMARPVAEQFGIPIYDTIIGALTGGGDQLDVDAVLLIAEHGDYPLNKKGQELYPKRRFFDEMVAVFEASCRAVPVYSDKHLSHSWLEAKQMVETAQRLEFGLMAGSSVPLAQRMPSLELKKSRRIQQAVCIHGGPLERYGFHGLEVLQSMVESRRGGESGIRSVKYVEGTALWRAAEDGLWSEELATRAMAMELGDEVEPIGKLVTSGEFRRTAPQGILVEYVDGLTAIVLRVGSSDTRWNFAAEIEGEDAPVATRFLVGPWNNRNLFKALSHAIQDLFRNKRAPYPVEQTLLASGALEAAIDSFAAGGDRIDTPQLEFSYPAVDFRAMREMGRSWEIITEDVEEPQGIEAVGVKTIKSTMEKP